MLKLTLRVRTFREANWFASHSSNWVQFLDAFGQWFGEQRCNRSFRTDTFCLNFCANSVLLYAFVSLEGNVHNKHDDSGSSVHPHSTLAPTLAVAFVLIIIFGAYFFFQCMGKRSQKSRNYDRMPQDEQAQNLMGEWSSFKGSGDKI